MQKAVKAGEGKKGQGKEEVGNGGGGEHGAAVKKPTTKAERRALQVCVNINVIYFTCCKGCVLISQVALHEIKKVYDNGRNLSCSWNVWCSCCVIEWIM